MGKQSNRFMTLVGPDGREKWSVPQRELFDEMKIDEMKDSFSSVFFTKNKIGVARSGSMVILKLSGIGLMGFDYNTGKKLFTLYL